MSEHEQMAGMSNAPDYWRYARKRPATKTWLKFPKGAAEPQGSGDLPSDMSKAEFIEGPAYEPPVCCADTPREIPGTVGVRKCGPCGSTWWP